MGRTIRYQGAIMRGDHLLLIKHREHASGRSYWLIPGGGQEAGETEEACVQREMREETGLEVTIERLLLDEPSIICGGYYQRFKTYLCRADSGEPQPGYEPEEDAARVYAIVETAWFDLRKPETWDPQVMTDPFTYPLLRKIQAALGYPVIPTD
jgi:ADP-ribose pyrophosphatase YjhB (NUDIX family)